MANPLMIACPRCRAPIGKPCRSSTGASVNYCKARVRRNPDEEYRRLERLAATGDVSASNQLLRKQIRLGQITFAQLYIAAFLGDLKAKNFIPAIWPNGGELDPSPTRGSELSKIYHYAEGNPQRERVFREVVKRLSQEMHSALNQIINNLVAREITETLEIDPRLPGPPGGRRPPNLELLRALREYHTYFGMVESRGIELADFHQMMESAWVLIEAVSRLIYPPVQHPSSRGDDPVYDFARANLMVSKIFESLQKASLEAVYQYMQPRESQRRNPDDEVQKALRQVNEGDYTAIPKLYRAAIRAGLVNPNVSLIPHTITLEKRFSDYHAHFDDNRGLWAAGRDVDDAIGGLLMNHHDYVGIDIIYPKTQNQEPPH